MSAGRRHRRALRRQAAFEPRRPDVELSAATRQLVAEVIAAHDDDSVSEAGFMPLMYEFAAHTSALPGPERLEANYQIIEHTSRAITGQKLVVVGMLKAGRT